MSQSHFRSSTFLLLILFFTIINHSSSARFLGGHDHAAASSHRHHHHHKITFLIKDVLNATTQPQQNSPTTKIPFSKPLGFFPPNGGIPIQEPTNSASPGGLSTQTLDVSNIGLYFPHRAALQELESGAVIVMDEDMFAEASVGGLARSTGKVQGVYVANSEDKTSHMMAMTAYFSGFGGFKDGLRFFGVHREDVNESHVAVIGGIGKYVGANGYATITTVDFGNSGDGEGEAIRLLLFNVYLS